MLSSADRFISQELAKFSHKDADYWEYRKHSTRYGIHGLLQYPAMMVPQMQADILDVILRARPDIRSILDPFVGAGTVMTEAMVQGRSFTGLDVNPLAVLTCQAKSQRFESTALREKIGILLDNIANDHVRKIDVHFPGRSKWFTTRAAFALSRIRRAIERESNGWARMVFWVVFAETIRHVSNSRTSTYKLHVRPIQEIDNLSNPLEIFSSLIASASDRFHYHQRIFEQKGLLLNGKYRKTSKIICGDIKNISRRDVGTHDLIITSPPYGDNHSTVPYGQFSFLALNWIPENDRPGDPALLASSLAIDTASLGGRKRLDRSSVAELTEAAPSFGQFIRDLQRLQRPDLEAKVCVFIADFKQATKAMLDCLKRDSYLAWTLGNRTVGGIPVPLVTICEELQHYFELKTIAKVRRRIPTKRTPIRNSISKTMSEECLLVTRF